MKKLTSYGVQDPVSLMQALYNVGQQALVDVMQTTSAPNERKELRVWGISAAAKMIGISTNTIRSIEQKHNLSPQKDESGRKAYSLAVINEIRDIAGKRFHKPKDVDPIICCAVNFKGGVGKSMTSLLLLQYLSLNGLKVLGIDLDPQATLTTWLGLLPDIDLKGNDTLATTLLENLDDIKRVIRKTYFTGIDIIPADSELSNVEIDLPHVSDESIAELGSPLKRLSVALDKVKNNYDVIIIDCPPNTAALTMNGVSAVNSVLITLPPSMPDFASFIRLTKTLERLFKNVRPHQLDFFRILFTKHKGTKPANNLDNTMRRLFGEFILREHMVDSSELDNTSNALLSLYEKPYATNSFAYRRAVEACNRVNNEIFEAFKEIWKVNTLQSGESNG